MSLKKLVRKFLDDPSVSDGQKEGIRQLWASHLATGRELQIQGRVREAIEEYANEHARPIESATDAEIVQSSYWFKGRAYRQLGEIDDAIEALQEARELLNLHGVGASPHQDLAEIYIDRKLFKEAKEICEEALSQAPSWPMKQLLAKAIEMEEIYGPQDQNSDRSETDME